jgi:hypothetical protein
MTKAAEEKMMMKRKRLYEDCSPRAQGEGKDAKRKWYLSSVFKVFKS